MTRTPATGERSGGVLRRELGLAGASAISAGLAFAAINFLAVAQLLRHVPADWAWLPVLAAAGVMLLVRGLFAELDGMRPSAAGIRLWLGEVMPQRLALVITMTYMITIVLVIAADAYIIGAAIGWALGGGRGPAMLYVAALVVLATVVNLRGVRMSALAEQLATYTVLALTGALGLVAVLGLAGPPPTAGQWGTTAPGGSPVQALVLAIFLFVGFEWVTTNSEEVTRPLVIPRAMLVALVLLAASWSVFAVAMGRGLTDAQLDSPYPQLLAMQQVIGRAGVLVMLAVTAITAVNTFNGGFVTLSRFLYAMAREGRLPAGLARLNDRAVPVNAVLLLGVVSLTVALLVSSTHAFDVLVATGAALEVAIFSAAGFAVWRLRATAAQRPRPYRFPGGRWTIAAVTVFFALLSAAAATSVGASTDPTPLLLIGGFALAATGYVWVLLPRMERRAAQQAAVLRAQRAAERARRAAQRAAATDAGTSTSAAISDRRAP